MVTTIEQRGLSKKASPLLNLYLFKGRKLSDFFPIADLKSLKWNSKILEKRNKYIF